MKIFYLKRIEDESGVSGTGRVAQGFIFDNGKVAVTWLSEHPSVTIYDSIGEIHAIHSHEGKTEIIMEPDYKRAFGELKSFVEKIFVFLGNKLVISLSFPWLFVPINILEIFLFFI